MKKSERSEPVNLQFMLMLVIVLMISDDATLPKKIRIMIKIMSMKKPGQRFAARALKLLPRKCRLGGSPVPFR